MNRERRPRIAAVFLLACWANWACEEQPAKAFLDGLRDRGYYDVALDYLTAAEKNPALPASFKDVLLYERATTLIQGAHLLRDSAAREQQLDDAQKVLGQFAKEKPTNLFAMAARNQLGSVMLERARSRVERAKKEPT